MKDNEIALVKEILKKLGASEEDCELVAEATIDADLKDLHPTDLEDSHNIWLVLKQEPST